MKLSPEEKNNTVANVREQWEKLMLWIRGCLAMLLIRSLAKGGDQVQLSSGAEVIVARSELPASLLEQLSIAVREGDVQRTATLLSTIESCLQFKGKLLGIDNDRFQSLKVQAWRLLLAEKHRNLGELLQAQKWQLARAELSHLLLLLAVIETDCKGASAELLSDGSQAQLNFCWAYIASELGRLKENLKTGGRIYKSEITAIEGELQKALRLAVNVLPFYRELEALKKQARKIGLFSNVSH